MPRKCETHSAWGQGQKDGSHLAVGERREAVDGVRESRLVRRDDGALDQVLLGVIPYLERWYSGRHSVASTRGNWCNRRPGGSAQHVEHPRLIAAHPVEPIFVRRLFTVVLGDGTALKGTVFLQFAINSLCSCTGSLDITVIIQKANFGY